MDKELKLKIKAEVKQIIEEIEFEEYQFNRVFHSNIEFQKAYYKFLKIYEKYGKDAYLKYVPFKYKKQEIKNLILDKNYVKIYEHYGINVIKKLHYTQSLYKNEFSTSNWLKIFFIKLKKIFSKNFISLPSQTILALPENICNNFDTNIEE